VSLGRFRRRLPVAGPWLVVGVAVTALAGCTREHPVLLGRSVHRRPIVAVQISAPRPRATVLVVGCIHGNEPAGIEVARMLRRAGPIPGIDLWVIDDLNPDGVAARTRQNADGVDLNRNFPWRWQHYGRRGDQQYPGERPLSEPEARLAHDLILRLRPRMTVWFHQPLAVTDESGGDIAIERRFAVISGLPLRRLPRYPGSASTWENHRLPGSTAFVVELPGKVPSRRQVERYVRAVRTVAASA
jgi:murein peptide amidase A